MLLWSGNDAIFGITICFHGRKMRIWLELLQKPFAEKISTILLKSIHIFCSHVGLYHSEKTDVWQGISYALRNFIYYTYSCKAEWNMKFQFFTMWHFFHQQPPAKKGPKLEKNEISAWSCNIIRLFLLLLTYCTSGLHLIFTLKNALLG